MAKNSRLKVALTGAAVAGMLFVAVAPSQAAGLWAQRFAALRGQTASTSSVSANAAGFGWKWQLIQYRAYKYNQIISRVLGPISPFCRTC